MESFEKYLSDKKIDPEKLKTAEPERWAKLGAQFEEMGVKSFDHSQKFHLNNLRYDFPLEESE